MASIDIGSPAINRASAGSSVNNSRLDRNNPANASGVLTSFEVWLSTAITDGSLIVGTMTCTLYQAPALPHRYIYTDYEAIGNCASGSKQIFTGKNCSVSSGDFLASNFQIGGIEMEETGSVDAYQCLSTNVFSSHEEFTFTHTGIRMISVCATGMTLLKIKIAGALKTAMFKAIKIGGAWKAVASHNIKISGAWK